MQIQRHSDTEMVITREIVQETVTDIVSKDDIINRIEYVREAIASTEKVLSERLQAFQKEAEELQIILNKMNLEGVKTRYEIDEQERMTLEKERIQKEIDGSQTAQPTDAEIDAAIDVITAPGKKAGSI